MGHGIKKSAPQDPSTHVVCMDDDVVGILVKKGYAPRQNSLEQLGPGGLQGLVDFAAACMLETFGTTFDTEAVPKIKNDSRTGFLPICSSLSQHRMRLT